MPTDACQFFYDCKGCGARLKPKPGDCCVFWWRLGWCRGAGRRFAGGEAGANEEEGRGQEMDAHEQASSPPVRQVKTVNDDGRR